MTNQGVEKMKRYQCRIALRLSNEQKERAEQLIFERKFKNLSQVIRAAIEEFLSKSVTSKGTEDNPEMNSHE
jgi:Arc/MetJ-type ribon-helix-helix transcriptional regulator